MEATGSICHTIKSDNVFKMFQLNTKPNQNIARMNEAIFNYTGKEVVKYI